MRKSADVVIPMQPSSDYSMLFPNQLDWNTFAGFSPDTPFSEGVTNFLNALSSSLMRDRQSRSYPDVITFAYFCRKANLLKLKSEYTRTTEVRLGRGILFHIAPSNVPINFGYSLVAGLLAGNANIVRVSSKNFPQVDLIIKHIQALAQLPEYAEIAARIALVRYNHSSQATAEFSSMADVRIIWGGDATIHTIRENQLPPRSFDVCFADRYSIAVLKPGAVLRATDAQIHRLAEAFYNDTYLFDQNACSAPHTVFWLAEDGLSEAKRRFWDAVHQYAAAKYALQPVMSVDKWTAMYREAVRTGCKYEAMPDNVVVRVELPQLYRNIDEFRCACGYFSEVTIERLDEIAPVVTKKYQTLAYYGIERDELVNFIAKNRPQGLDRLVPIGETTAFSLTWDGYNLIDTLSRVCSILP